MLGRDIAFYLFRLPMLELRPRDRADDDHPDDRRRRRRACRRGESGPRSAARRVRASRPPRATCRCWPPRCSLVLAFGAWLHIPQLLTAQSGVVSGATYVGRPRAHAGAVGCWSWPALLGAALARLAGVDGRRGCWPIVCGDRPLRRGRRSAAASTPAIIQRFVVAPNEQVRETPFIEHNIAATRAAFGARPGRGARSCRATRTLTRADIDAQRRDARQRAALGSPAAARHVRRRSRRSAPTTTSSSVDNDRYMINGKYRQIMLSARELNSASLPNRTWINEQLTFTHGYGLTLGPGERGDAGRPAGAVHHATCRRCRPSTCKVDAAEHLLRRAVERLRVRQDEDARSSTTRAATTTSSRPTQGSGGVPLSDVVPAAAVRDPLPLDRHVLLATTSDAREPRDDPPADRRARRRRSRRS